MGMFLNSSAPFQNYNSTTGSAFFVDKPPMIGELIPFLRTEQRYFCITRPRRPDPGTEGRRPFSIQFRQVIAKRGIAEWILTIDPSKACYAKHSNEPISTENRMAPAMRPAVSALEGETYGKRRNLKKKQK